MEALNREVLKGELHLQEGTKYRAYKDTNDHWSIGTGRNLDRRNPDGTIGITKAETDLLKITRASCLQKGIIPAQSDVLLDHDIDGALADLDRHLPWWRTLDPVRQRVLANMCFNMGIGTLMTFKGTLGCIANHRFDDAADHMLATAWAHQVHDRAKYLANLMRLGPKTH